MIHVELVYSPDSKELFQKELSLEEGATLYDAILLSEIFLLYPETQNYNYGIFSRIQPKDTPLKSGDRVEIYRPLKIDPKENRRKKK